MKERIVRRKKYRRNPNYKKNVAFAIAAAILGVAAVFVIVVVCLAIHYVGLIHYEPLDPDYTLRETLETETNGPTGVEETKHDLTDQDIIDAYEKEAEEALEKLGLTLADVPLDDVFNVLLVGTDNRITGYSGRSDTVMLLSINFRTKKITLTSFLRDLHVYLPGKDIYGKLNAAYQYGGIEMLMDTMQHNFSMKIDYYISVDFFAFMQVVDILGGLDVEVQADELFWLNEYIHANNLLLGCYEYEDYLDDADGRPQHLNGKQVLAYSRFRYVGNGDFTRTERQRKMLNLAYDKVKHASPDQLMTLLETILPEITTNIPKEVIYSMLVRVPEMSSYDIMNWGIPDDRYTYISMGDYSNLAIDYTYYVTRLYELIYGNVIEVQTEQEIQH